MFHWNRAAVPSPEAILTSGTAHDVRISPPRHTPPHQCLTRACVGHAPGFAQLAWLKLHVVLFQLLHRARTASASELGAIATLLEQLPGRATDRRKAALTATVARLLAALRSEDTAGPVDTKGLKDLRSTLQGA